MDEETLHDTVKALVKARQYEKALGAVGTFLAEHGQADLANVSAFVEQGYILFKMQRFRNSLAAFDQAIELNAESDPAWVGRAQALCELRRDQDALSAYRRARNLAPQDARSLNGLGFILIA